jgi:hypothetical protein
MDKGKEKEIISDESESEVEIQQKRKYFNLTFRINLLVFLTQHEFVFS